MNRGGNLGLLLGLSLLTGFFAACGTEPPAGNAVGGGTAGVGPAGAASGVGGVSAPTGGSPAGGSAGSGVGGSLGGSSGAAPGGVGGVGGSGAEAGGGTGNIAGVGQGGGGVSGAGGTAGVASGGSGGGAVGNCNFTVMSQTADKAGSTGIPTVGIVNWSVDLTGLTMANISFGLDGGTPMTAPVDPAAGPNFRTLLLGMKGSRMYTFRINVSNGTTSCQSTPYTIQTGAVSNMVPRITRTAGSSASPRAGGFFVTSTGIGGGGGGSYVYIFDADGDPVWWVQGPTQCSRAKMSYEGTDMWMATLNVQNGTNNGGGVDRVSMDGLTRMNRIAGLSNCHHDITTLPGGKLACASWIRQSGDQPSDLIERDAAGTITTFRRLDQTVYVGGGSSGTTYHANALHYNQADDTYIVADRNPNLMVKVGRSGVIWQFGGSCTNAPAPSCVAGSWRVNHGFHRPDASSLLFFNNNTSGASTAYKFTISDTGMLTATEAWNYRPGTTSNVLGDVQQLANGNVVVAFSTAGVIHEIDSSRTLIQSFSVGAAGYVEWRPTLYGPPPAGR